LIPNPQNVLDYNRYAYARYNPLKYGDPTGHNPKCGPDGVWCDDDSSNDYDYPDIPGSYMPPSALTENGREAVNIWHAYVKVGGWWNADGDFTVMDFLGMWILFEGKSGYGAIWTAQSNWISISVGQNLYVGGFNDPQGSSSNAVFNFIGSWLDGSSSLREGPDYNQLLPKNFPTVDDHEAFMKELGAAALHPTQLNFDRNNATSDWGNIKGAWDIQKSLKANKIPWGSEENSVYYLNPSFVVLSINQRSHWISEGVNFDHYVPE